MSKKETKVYKTIWKKGADEAAKKFGFIRPEDVIRKNVQRTPTSKIDQILTGWGNYVKSHFVELAPELKAEGQKRLEICNSCSMRDRGTCSTARRGKHVITGEMMKGCGCKLAAKALSPKSVCPLGKW